MGGGSHFLPFGGAFSFPFLGCLDFFPFPFISSVLKSFGVFCVFRHFYVGFLGIFCGVVVLALVLYLF